MCFEFDIDFRVLSFFWYVIGCWFPVVGVGGFAGGVWVGMGLGLLQFGL